jgi:putative endonuclease
MLRCDDNSVYTGFTTDIKRRFKEHTEKNKPYGKYTRAHTALRIEAVWSSESKKEACRLEYYIKRLKKENKELLIKEPHRLQEMFDGKLDCSAFLQVDCADKTMYLK